MATFRKQFSFFLTDDKKMYQTYVEWILSYEASEILVFYVKMK